ncbi:hypothetical protein AOL_s00079g385 [Orbilia oligospora ATCC 24927]|uniref:Aminoglycoside phosphotransferase domain-containing protein n=1 Tax=Arthrobotrys oligospora (strain ATCC 24927 / CBS 115.81 / DSM 1491) TaxID=756982 RepID=G1XDK0_ARTOA|nr:hypothetical protein AOL_s00079g385 [Orbilia oligospora ATCC 24927]EGX48746.1 hypothetical protein AOL_s00079g385 [Orbilia oligospora ATCC 24927]
MSRVLTAEELERAINLLPDIGTVKKIDDNTILKVGSYRLSEAATMQYIAENTTIPVPKVYGSYKDEKTQKTHLVMEYIEGDCLEDVWEDFGLEKKEDIISQLKRILDELRSLEGTFIGCVDHTHCEDVLFSETETPRGPYSSEEEFSQGIIDTLLEKEATAFPRLVCEMVQDILKGHKIVLTHGDFLPRNILVKDGKVVAILDWEMAGWYPEYWEYTKIMYRPPYLKSWFKDGMVNKLIKPYYAELAVLMQARQLIW